MPANFVKRLRSNQTPQENQLWYRLRAKRFDGFKFRRQHTLGPFIVDFVCLEHKLVIELDGGQHVESSKDAARDDWLNQKGYRVLRFWNMEVTQSMDAVLDGIWRALQEKTGSNEGSDGN